MKKTIVSDVCEIINTHNTRDPFLLCNLLHINLFYHNLYNILKGYYIFYNKQHNIVINNTISKNEQRIVLGHELGHAIEHASLSQAFTESRIGINGDKLEFEANLFCSELLIPDEEILSLINYEYSFGSICEELGFPPWLIDCKLHMLIYKGHKELHYLYIANKNSIKI